MKRQHRSTLDRCRIYLEKRLRLACFGFANSGLLEDDDWFESFCDEVAREMDGDLTFNNWRIACDSLLPN